MKQYLFDFDGTLVDSMPTFASVMLRILDETGTPYGEDIVRIITPLGLKGTADYFVSIGVPLSVSADYSFIVPTGTMLIHPVRMSGMVIGARQTYEYFQRMQDRITGFIAEHSKA